MIFLYALIFLLGASITSFYQLIIFRRSIQESWIFGRSRCDYCGKNLSIRALFPFFHYFLLGGITSCCQRKISFVPAFFEFVGGAMLCLICYRTEYTGDSVFYSIFYLSLYFLVLQDIFDHSIYYLDLVLVIFILFLNGIFHKFNPNILPIVFTVAIYLFIYILAKGGFGLGDVYFGILLSLLAENIYQAFYIFLWGFILASIYGGYLLIARKANKESKIPLTPFLWFGSFIHFFSLY